ncbi:hypothetical protein [Fimbriiglobus ruber]|uniref:hypothetical protein n=1 Tax=Fimbriiglobus ruber TaxID=1908690 RepID=UPI00117B16CD|nr:hypothetical protein [Fimbriiglobus ruber]
MSHTSICIFIVSVAISILIGVWSIELNDWSVFGPDDICEDAKARQTRIIREQYFEKINLRIARKNALLDDLAAGDQTLAQVADEFVRLDQIAPSYTNLIRTRYPGNSDQEREANMAFEYISFRPFPPAERIRVITRLQREFETAFGHPVSPKYQ